MAIGAALALRGTGRLPIAVLGDGDFVMGASALWTAAHYRLPLLAVVANNRSFFNDEIHQHQVAVRRDRPTANRWIGQHIRDPEIDIIGLAAAQGVTGRGPVTHRSQLESVIAQAVDEVRAGKAVVVDVRIGSSVEHETARAVTQGGRR
jgi:thiamine pyrophosphate-dependent acetolactate synthase large subunit-like protein